MKTIDVREGDTWKWFADESGGLCQYRDDQWRWVDETGIRSEWTVGRKARYEVDIPTTLVYRRLFNWGYQFTRDPAEDKPTPPAVKENLTTDVPVVDAVCVDHEGRLHQYASHARAEQAWGDLLTNGTARIVRIRTVDEEARQTIDETRNTVRELDKAAFTFDERLSALESRLAAEKTADKDAARVVKAPGRINASEYAQTHWPISVIPYVENAIAFTHLRWREALASQGITVADEGSSSNG